MQPVLQGIFAYNLSFNYFLILIVFFKYVNQILKEVSPLQQILYKLYKSVKKKTRKIVFLIYIFLIVFLKILW